MKQVIGFLFLYTLSVGCLAQGYTSQDSIRGMITKEREWWDLKYYHLSIEVDLEKKLIEGTNIIQYQVLNSNMVMQIDLQLPMKILKATQEGEELKFERNGNAYYIKLNKKQIANEINEVIIEYSGIPRAAPNPPWDSGIVWEKDSLGQPFAASTSWGAGSSQWWPCKDHSYDEVDSLKFSIRVQKNMVAVANGRLLKTIEHKDNTKTFNWVVSNPINTYGINFNIGDYINFSEIYSGEKGPLQCDFYVLKNNFEKAKKHFKQVSLMLEAFEYWFGPYPFYEDSYKLVEVPYVGMEHQSATAYGNNYQNGYFGYDQSNTGWGKKWDLLIVHESAHEWFAGNISFRDIADIWIHESFTTYSEGLFTEYYYGKSAGDDYQLGIRKSIKNDRPLIGNYDINDLGYTSDNYQKGAAILHMLRQIINDDDKWRHILRGLNKQFYHQTVSSQQIEDFIATESGHKLEAFWDQYLRTMQIPVFEYYFADNQLSYRWINCIDKFKMPLKIKLNGENTWVYPKKSWQSLPLKGNMVDLEVDRNFYVASLYSNAKED